MITIRVEKSTKCNSDYSMYISFPYNSRIIDVIRELPTRYWNNAKKEWEVPADKLSYITDRLTKFDIQIVGELDKAYNNEETKEIPNNFEFKTKPYKHQIEGLQFGLSHDRWLLSDEQGLGKTKQVIDLAMARKLSSGIKHCLIVCGVNGLKWNWQNEILTHSNESGWIIGQRRKKNGKVSIGSMKERIKDLENIENIKDFFLITNVETLRDAEICDLLKKYREDRTKELVAIDEIHKCKNPSSQQGKGILQLQSKYRIAMTGTPLMNSPLDLYIVLRWLGYEKHALKKKKNHYCVMGGFGGYEIVSYKNMGELKERVDKIMLRRLKDDVLDLPEKVYIDEYVEMSGKQEQIYKEVTADIRSNIDKIKTSPNPLAELIRMRQATGYTGILSTTISESAKIDRLEEIVEEAVLNNRKVVIFSNWTQMTTPVYNRLSKNYKGVVITGETDDVSRQVFVNTFQTNDDCKFILGTIGAMGTGLTLTAGSIVVFLDEPWTMANKQQAIDRCHRIGTKSTVTVYTIMCKDTIDERIHELVEKKGAMSDALIDGKITGNREELIDFLIN